MLTFVAIITKVIGCAFPAGLGLRPKDALIVGFGMAPRGEVAMIVALIGLEAGVIGQGVYVVLGLMSLLTTIITPIVYGTGSIAGSIVNTTRKGPALTKGNDGRKILQGASFNGDPVWRIRPEPE